MAPALGHFVAGESAAYEITTPNLPQGWEYIYQNRKLLLKVDQFGPVYAQVNPPGDIILIRREPFQRSSSWLCWIRSPLLKDRMLTNFFRPNMGFGDPAALPDDYRVHFTPTMAVYEWEYRGLACRSELNLAADAPSIMSAVTIINRSRRATRVELIPVLRPYVNPATLAPWDRPEWYLRSAFFADRTGPGFWTNLMNMNSEAEKRRTVILRSSREGFQSAEIRYENFVGQGSFDAPGAAFADHLRLRLKDAKPWGVFAEANAIAGYPPIYASQYAFDLPPGGQRTIRQVLALLPNGPAGALARPAAARKAAVHLTAQPVQVERDKTTRYYHDLLAQRTITTSDAEFNRYVNEWLPLQLDWVCSLDRGWPSGMRGSRDSANDFTAMVWIDPGWSKQILRTLLTCQRSDGWFPRQYSAAGRKGAHDLRGHVDAGNWVIELAHEYLAVTGDYALLSERLPWLDRDANDTVLGHLLKALDYFITPNNLGPHGLCKIGEGDWLDSVNRPGLAGRGESVTVTCQTLMSLPRMERILREWVRRNSTQGVKVRKLASVYDQARRALVNNLRKQAWNRAGFYSSVCNDDGRWLFSEKDPDGERRVYGPANWFAVASGAATPEQYESIFNNLAFLKAEAGYRLYWPPLGKKPIPNVGRAATGDQPAGLWENGNVYNQGSHGFLGRALAVAGMGDRLYEVLRYMLPYDQSLHPVAKTGTPPYAVTNCWQNVPGFHHRGGLLSLTGSIAYALRMAYEWMAGIQPTLDGLAIDPVVPRSFKEMTVRAVYRGRPFELIISNPAGRQHGVRSITHNGEAVVRVDVDAISGRRVPVLEAQSFKPGRNIIEVTI